MKRVSLLFVLSLFFSSHLFAATSLTLNPVDKPILSLVDFTQAKVSEDHGKTVVLLKLTDEGARKLKSFSASHVGEKLAIVVDDQVVSAPVIRVPIISGGVSIDALSRADADALARMINAQGVR